MADRVQLTQVLQNLVANAIKFSKGVPQVHVGAEREGDHWRMSVRDNGIGIAPEYAERIFEIFKRLHGWGEYPGTGIGLAVCKKLVERQGGQSGSSRRRGRGARSFSRCPLVKGMFHEQRIPRNADRNLAGRGQSRRCALTQEVLRDGKVRNTLRVAGDGEEALAMLRRKGASPIRRAPT